MEGIYANFVFLSRINSSIWYPRACLFCIVGFICYHGSRIESRVSQHGKVDALLLNYTVSIQSRLLLEVCLACLPAPPHPQFYVRWHLVMKHCHSVRSIAWVFNFIGDHTQVCSRLNPGCSEYHMWCQRYESGSFGCKAGTFFTALLSLQASDFCI